MCVCEFTSAFMCRLCMNASLYVCERAYFPLIEVSMIKNHTRTVVYFDIKVDLRTSDFLARTPATSFTKSFVKFLIVFGKNVSKYNGKKI